MNGGKDGAAGENLLLRKRESDSDAKEGANEDASDQESPDGNLQRLASQCEVQIEAGDCLILLTPGGGGYGKPED